MIGFRMLALAELSGLAGLLSLSGCVTPAEKQQFKDDIFNLQTRMVQIEGQSNNLGKEITTQTSRQEASINTRLDKYAIEFQRLKGDIDALRMGVTTGKMPGTDPDQEGTVSKSLGDMALRLEALEENQNKILAAIDKAIDTKKPEKKESSKASKKGANLKSLDDMRTAFEKKKYKLVADEGSKIIDDVKGKKDKQEGLYILAESYFKAGQIRDAALRFAEYIATNPKEHASHSYLRMGDCFKDLGDIETAKIYYQETIQKYSASDEAKQAKTKLAKL